MAAALPTEGGGEAFPGESRLARFSVYGPTGVFSINPDEVLAYARGRHAHGERIHLLQIDASGSWWDPGVDFVFDISREADDLPPERVGGKGVLDCAHRTITVWVVGPAEVVPDQWFQTATPTAATPRHSSGGGPVTPDRVGNRLIQRVVEIVEPRLAEEADAMSRRAIPSLLWLGSVVLLVAPVAFPGVGAETGVPTLASSTLAQAASPTPRVAGMTAVPVPSCPVTLPNGSTPPGETPQADFHGNGAIWTTLWPCGRIPIPPDAVDPDGALEMKFPWWWQADGKLVVSGRRLDGPSPPLRAVNGSGRRLDLPEPTPAGFPVHYPGSGFQATTLIFPTAGCWEVTATVGNASLTFVTLVTRADRLPGTPTATPAATPEGDRS